MGEFRDRERAVSEVFGFILLFSIVILSIGAVSIFGVNSLHDGRDAAMMDNVEQGFIGIGNSLNNVETGLSQSASIQVQDGTISMKGGTRMRVSVGGSTALDKTVTPIIYNYENNQLVSVGTALFRIENGGGVVVSSPSFKLSEEHTIVTIPRTVPTRSLSVGGGTANLRFVTSSSSSPTLDAGSQLIRILVDSPTETQADLWETALENRLKASGMSSSSYTCTRATPQAVACEYTTNTNADILVRSLLVEVSLS